MYAGRKQELLGLDVADRRDEGPNSTVPPHSEERSVVEERRPKLAASCRQRGHQRVRPQVPLVGEVDPARQRRFQRRFATCDRGAVEHFGFQSGLGRDVEIRHMMIDPSLFGEGHQQALPVHLEVDAIGDVVVQQLEGALAQG